MKTWTLSVSVVLLAVNGCAGQIAPDRSDDDAAQAQRAGGAEEPAPSTDVPTILPPSASTEDAGSPRPLACGVPGEVQPIDSEAALLDRLLGHDWIHCGGWSMFGIEHDGFVVDADGSWHFLRYDAAGQLQRQQGFDGGGTWEVVDTTAMNGGTYAYQLNLDTPNGSNYMQLAFQDGPEALRMGTMGYLADYVREPAAGDPPVDPPPPAPPSHALPSTCGIPGDVLPSEPAEALQTRLTSQDWLYCSGSYLFDIQHDGVALDPDGTWRFLRYDLAGQLVRQKGFDGQGTWDVLPSGQVNLNLAVRGGYGLFPAFQTSPDAMRLGAGQDAEYVPAN